MPTYDYACPHCADHTTAQRAVADRDDAPLCSMCRCRMRRLPSAPAVQFKGAGFHVNDYPKRTR